MSNFVSSNWPRGLERQQRVLVIRQLGTVTRTLRRLEEFDYLKQATLRSPRLPADLSNDGDFNNNYLALFTASLTCPSFRHSILAHDDRSDHLALPHHRETGWRGNGGRL